MKGGISPYAKRYNPWVLTPNYEEGKSCTSLLYEYMYMVTVATLASQT